MNGAKADVAQSAERVLGKDEVTSSILVIGSSLRLASWNDATTNAVITSRASEHAYGEREI